MESRTRDPCVAWPSGARPWPLRDEHHARAFGLSMPHPAMRHTLLPVARLHRSHSCSRNAYSSRCCSTCRQHNVGRRRPQARRWLPLADRGRSDAARTQKRDSSVAVLPQNDGPGRSPRLGGCPMPRAAEGGGRTTGRVLTGHLRSRLGSGRPVPFGWAQGRLGPDATCKRPVQGPAATPGPVAYAPGSDPDGRRGRRPLRAPSRLRL